MQILYKLWFPSAYRKIAAWLAILANLYLVTGCATTAQTDAMQQDINQLEDQINILHERISKQLSQMDRTTRVTLASQNDLQVVQNQLEENVGEVDSLKTRVKKIEETGLQNSANYASTININEKSIIKLQRQIARLELQNPEPINTTSSAQPKVPLKIKNAKDVKKLLQNDYEKGNFKEVIQKATTVLEAKHSSSEMMAVALEFRGEGKFQLLDYRGAAIDLSNFVERYPHAEKHARALLILGDSYVYLKNQSIAASYYGDCIHAYANTPEGAACAERAEKL